MAIGDPAFLAFSPAQINRTIERSEKTLAQLKAAIQIAL